MRERAGRFVLLLAGLAALAGGCALGGGPGPREDAGDLPPGFDAGMSTFDAGCGGSGCTPPPDADGDGVPVSQDCDDADPAVGRTASRACTTMCGSGTETCSSGVWTDCDAPTMCNCMEPRVCSPGDVEMGALCGMCGRQERRCRTDCRWGPSMCVEEGECSPGTMDTPETRACPGTCGGTQTRSRTCTSGCTWGTFTDWGPTCPTCGPVCGDGTCTSPETCSSCADCRAGHMGTGSGGSSCAGVPEGQWRCVTQSGLGVVSQVCRSGSWLNFNLNPQNCNACVCSFTTACCQVGSPSAGC
ncbi:MAG: hypothetical protein AB7S26_18605 [Sandaracinaceae bacterium]